MLIGHFKTFQPIISSKIHLNGKVVSQITRNALIFGIFESQ